MPEPVKGSLISVGTISPKQPKNTTIKKTCYTLFRGLHSKYLITLLTMLLVGKMRVNM